MLAILSSLGLLHSGGRSRNVLVPPLKIAMMGGEKEGELITILPVSVYTFERIQGDSFINEIFMN